MYLFKLHTHTHTHIYIYIHIHIYLNIYIYIYLSIFKFDRGEDCMQRHLYKHFIYMDYMENQFLKNEQIEPWIWLRYIDDIFSFGQPVKKNLMLFWNDSTIFILI